MRIFYPAVLVIALIAAGCNSENEPDGATSETLARDAEGQAQSAAQTSTPSQTAGAGQQRAWTPPIGPRAPTRTDLFGFSIGMTEAQMLDHLAGGGWRREGGESSFNQPYTNALNNYALRNARYVSYVSTDGQDALRFFVWDRGDGTNEIYAITWDPYVTAARTLSVAQRGELREAWMNRFAEMYGSRSAEFVFSPDNRRIDSGPDANGPLNEQCTNRVVVSTYCGLVISERREAGRRMPYVIYTNGQTVAWLRNETPSTCTPTPTQQC